MAPIRYQLINILTRFPLAFAMLFHSLEAASDLLAPPMKSGNEDFFQDWEDDFLFPKQIYEEPVFLHSQAEFIAPPATTPSELSQPLAQTELNNTSEAAPVAPTPSASSESTTEEKKNLSTTETRPALSPNEIAAGNPNGAILINFNNVNIVEFIRFISRISNKNFIFDDADLQFNVTIVSEEPTTLPNILTALMQVLRVHDLMLIEQGNNILIHRNKGVNQISQVVTELNAKKIKEGELITRVFRLNSLDPEKAAMIIQPLTSEGALVEVLKETGHLIVTDISSNVENINILIKSLDAPFSGLTIGQYVVVNALLDSLVSLGEKIMEPIAEGRALVFVPHVPSNSIFVVSTPYLVDRALAILRTLDINQGETQIFTPESLRFTGTSQEKQPKSTQTEEEERRALEQRLREQQEGLLSPEGGSRGDEGSTLQKGSIRNASPWSSGLPPGHIERTKFYIHKLRYRKGDQIVDALGKVGLALQESGTGNLDLVATIQSIQWLEASNSLVFTGTVNSIGKVKELIEEIDVPLRQVFIEMLIMETTLDDSLDYGVNFASRFNNKGNTAGAQGFLSEVAPLANALDTATIGGALDPSQLARTTGYNLGILGRNITHCGLEFGSIGALVSAMHDKQKDQIIMNPKILVEDNTPAEIFVGLNTSFKTQSITNDQGNIITNNFEFRDVGTLLKVTPLISNNDMITLEIHEEVSSVVSTGATAGSLDSQSTGPTTRINRTTTKFHVPNKFFLVMSGMIQDDYNRRRIQVPCLGGVPVLGALFSQKTIKDQKRNLMIFIRPMIIDKAEDIDLVTRHQQDAFNTQLRTKKMWKYEVEEALDLLNVKEPDVSLHDSEEFNP